MLVASTITMVDALADADVEVGLIWSYLACSVLLMAAPSKIEADIKGALDWLYHRR
jgi:hypothetical protein